MLNQRINRHLSNEVDKCSTPCVIQEVNELLQNGYSALINSKDYQLEAAACAINGLTEENETADIYLYAAIERNDWQTVSRIYQTIFRPYLYEHAVNCVINALTETPNEDI